MIYYNSKPLSLKSYPCNLCNSYDEEFLFTKKGVITEHPFNIVICKKCGLIYINPRLDESSIMELYDEKYYEGQGFDEHVNYLEDYKNKNELEKVFNTTETINMVEEAFKGKGSLLDFGCGVGDLISTAHNHGFEVEGYEVSEFARNFVSNSGFKVYSSLLQIPKNKYDIVTAIEVLEHCSDPMKVIRTIFESLKPGGLFYYTTANFDGYYKAYKNKHRNETLENYILPEGHIHFFSTEVMKKYFNNIGFSKLYFYNPKIYRKSGPLYQILKSKKLIKSNKVKPESLLENLLYTTPKFFQKVIFKQTANLPLCIK
jgi:2-polyprenyl-3-methyl-5-hydroxy-6-metoxy-1,4-benzoquinol methylase